MEDTSIKRKEKRGMKPKSKRNRKRARGGVGIVDFEKDSHSDDCTEKNARAQVQVDILPLEMPTSAIDSNNDSRIVDKEDGCDSTMNTADTTDCEATKSIKIQRRIRVVRPYPFTFGTFAKARWIGRSILDVYNDEFGSYPKAYYESAIRQGRILVNGKRVDCSHKIKDGVELSHVVHRHEPAVALCDIHEDSHLSSSLNPTTKTNHIDKSPYVNVIHEDDSIIVVDKPSTVPVHPCGGYNFNSLFHILQDQDTRLVGKLHGVHRLDRLTSGLTIIAKSTEVAKSLSKCIADRDNCHKVYLARVKGTFPCNAPKDLVFDFKEIKSASTAELDAYVTPCINGEWNPDLGRSDDGRNPIQLWFSNDGDKVQADATLRDVFNSRIDATQIREDGSVQNATWLNLACPCEIVCHKNGICKAGTTTGKAAQTAFTVISYDAESDSTTVLVRPQTGRSHQIRLHLQYLGHPICNDPNYGGDMFYGNRVAQDNFRKASKMMKNMDNENTIPLSHDKQICKVAKSDVRPDNAISTDVPATEREVQNTIHERREDEPLLDYIQRSCVWCARTNGEDRSVLEFMSRSQGIMLHAYQYAMKVSDTRKLCYKTEFPYWKGICST